MESFFAEVKIFRFWPKTMDYNKAFWPKSRSFFVVLLLQNGRCYEAEICAILLPLRYAFAWYRFCRSQRGHFLPSFYYKVEGATYETEIVLCMSAGNNSDWDEFVRSRARRWVQMMEWPLQSSTQHPVLLIKYEDLKRDVVATVAKMLDFLGYPYTGRYVHIHVCVCKLCNSWMREGEGGGGGDPFATI